MNSLHLKKVTDQHVMSALAWSLAQRMNRADAMPRPVTVMQWLRASALRDTDGRRSVKRYARSRWPQLVDEMEMGRATLCDLTLAEADAMERDWEETR
jgi:hypothetical protein